jgi:hypothetical protein
MRRRDVNRWTRSGDAGLDWIFILLVAGLAWRVGACL